MFEIDSFPFLVTAITKPQTFFIGVGFDNPVMDGNVKACTKCTYYMRKEGYIYNKSEDKE